eukprot:SAG31_NODE_11132_length_1062_cov_1.688474_2_plen_23_part_01
MVKILEKSSDGASMHKTHSTKDA